MLDLKLPGQYYDSETSLFQNRWREYDPKQGKYIQSDPLGLVTGFNTYEYVGSNPISFVGSNGLKPWDFKGRGDISVCVYYDKRVKETCGKLHDYYVEAGQICKGTRSDVNLMMDGGIVTSWSFNSTSKSQADIYNQVGAGLISQDKALVTQYGSRRITGDMIDSYHEKTFKESGINPSFYGGNRWPQGVWPNPVPFDKEGKTPLTHDSYCRKRIRGTVTVNHTNNGIGKIK